MFEVQPTFWLHPAVYLVLGSMLCELLSVYTLGFRCARLTNALFVELRSLYMETMALVVISARIVTFIMHHSMMLVSGP